MKISKSKTNHFGLTFIASGDATNGQYFLSETLIPPGDKGPPFHIHSNEDEGFYVLSGELMCTVNDEDVHLKTGDHLIIEKGEKHSWRNDSMHDAKVMILFVPAGIEGMFKELDENIEDLIQIGRKYGTEFIVE